MWELKNPKPVKLIIGTLAANVDALDAAQKAIIDKFGPTDLESDTWPFTQTDYYKDETGPDILRRFVSIETLIDPGSLAEINLDPGFIEPSKLILASTKNFSHRIYIGNKMYAEVTLTYDKGAWRHYVYTFPDYRQSCYHDFFTKVRTRLLEQLKSCH